MSNYKILLVEDDSPWQKILKTHIETALRRLETHGYIRIAVNLEKALDIINEENDWSLLCTDIGLEGSHDNKGAVLVGLAAERNIPTVIVSGTPAVTPQLVRDFFMEYNVEDFFSKQRFDTKAFTNIVKRILENPKRL